MPDITRAVLPGRTALLDDRQYVAVLRGYDEAIDWDPNDVRLTALADAAVDLAGRMTIVSDLPSFDRVPAEVVEILTTGHVGQGSPAWNRVDELASRRLARRAT